MAVVAEKLGMGEPVEVTPAMRRGLDFEERLAAIAETALGEPVGFAQAWLQHAELEWPRATIDGVLLPREEATIADLTGILELKTRGVHVPRPTDYYLAQTHWQMWVADVERAVIVEGVFDDDDDRLIRVSFEEIRRDDRLLGELIELGEAMRSWVLRGEVPPPSHANDAPVVRSMFADADTTADAVDISEHLALIEARQEAKAEVESLTNRIEAINATLIAAIGHATKAAVPGWSVSYSAPSRVLTAEGERAVLAARPDLGVVVLDKARAKKEAADLIDAHKESVGVRRLSVRQKKGN